MSSKDEKLEALIKAAYENGESVESCGEYDEDSEEGHDVNFIKHGGLFLVVERIDDEENIESYTDEDEAREAFEEIKSDILNEESD